MINPLKRERFIIWAFGLNRIYYDFYDVFDLITCYLSYTRKGSIIHALLA